MGDVLLLHKPGASAARPSQELEGDEGVQERCLLVAQGARREGRELALAGAGRRADKAHQGAGRLHRCERRGPVQGRHLPVLSSTEHSSRDLLVMFLSTMGRARSELALDSCALARVPFRQTLPACAGWFVLFALVGSTSDSGLSVLLG